MKIIKLESLIEGWDLTGELTRQTLKEGEKQGFQLINETPFNNPAFVISAEIHFSELDSDFLLDVKIKSIAVMEFEGERATVKELYEAYCEVRKEWRMQILRRSMSEGFTLLKEAPPTPFEILEPLLNQTLFNAYPLS